MQALTEEVSTPWEDGVVALKAMAHRLRPEDLSPRSEDERDG